MIAVTSKAKQRDEVRTDGDMRSPVKCLKKEKVSRAFRTTTFLKVTQLAERCRLLPKIKPPIRRLFIRLLYFFRK